MTTSIAAGTVTGSRYLVSTGSGRILIDCGLFQGLKRLRERNWQPPPIDPKGLDAVVLTHAHLDHTGYLPVVARAGFRGPVYCTRATRDLLGILLPDSARIQEEEAEYANRRGYSKHRPALPLYTEADAETALRLLRPVDWSASIEPVAGVTVHFSPAGHLLGAASVLLESASGRVLFSGDLGKVEDLRPFAGDERLNMTKLALNLSEHVNGVARRHAEVSRRIFPGYEVSAITNGVHPWTWACDGLRALYDAHLPRWCHEPELLTRAGRIPDDALQQAHTAAKDALLAYIRSIDGPALDAGLPVIGFARRMTAYKRPDLLFSDLERLKRIARRYPFQVVLAGKAHLRDGAGKELIERLHGWAGALRETIPVVFIPDNTMDVARLIVAGADVWLNTPQRPFEASGTSGMKAALNGVPHLSVPDGWWAEGLIEGITGWSVAGEADAENAGDGASLHEKLEHVVLPLYH
jgi:glyoxylase-like metal-dependent hydrolase (beta-lactamase superfamily II)